MVSWRPELSDAKEEAGTANHEGMAGLQQPSVHTVMETLTALHTTKNSTLSPPLHIRKFTTCCHSQEVWLLHYPTDRASFLIIYMTCTTRDLHLNWQNRSNAGISDEAFQDSSVLFLLTISLIHFITLIEKAANNGLHSMTNILTGRLQKAGLYSHLWKQKCKTSTPCRNELESYSGKSNLHVEFIVVF